MPTVSICKLFYSLLLRFAYTFVFRCAFRKTKNSNTRSKAAALEDAFSLLHVLKIPSLSVIIFILKLKLLLELRQYLDITIIYMHLSRFVESKTTVCIKLIRLNLHSPRAE